MTINTSIRKAGPYAGNGIATVFPFDFKVFAANDLRVVYADLAGLEIDLTLGADYAVTMNPNQDANPGGTVILAEPLETGARLTVTSSLEYLQATELTNAGGFYPRVLNDTHDRLVIYIQQLAEQVDRTLKSSITSPTSASLPAPEPLYLIGWNSDGSGFANYPPGSGGGSGSSGTVTSVSVATANGLAGTVSSATTSPVLTLQTTITGIAKAVAGAFTAATAGADYVAPGAYASANGLTMGANRLLGRSSAGSGAAQEIEIGAGLTLSSGVLSAPGGGSGGSGTVTSVSVVAGNGFSGSVANSTTAPEITLATSVPNGMIKSVLGGLSSASAGTDYVAPGAATGSGLTMATNKLIGRSSAGTGALEELSIGSGLSLSGGTLSAGVTLPIKLITDFGAIPNTGVDNTAAFQAAMDWIVANKRPVFIPAGRWLTQAVTLYTGSNQDWCGFVGEDPKTTVVAYFGTTPANTAMFTIGSSSMTAYVGNMRFANITFQANGSNTNATPFRIYDLAWATFDNCNFQGGDVAFDCLGGVNVTFEQCGFQYAASTGLRIDKFTRAGGGWPNNIKINGGVVGANSKIGIYFDYGRQLVLDGVQIEGNGTTAGNASQAGLYVGANIGTETGTQATNAHSGVVCRQIWFEENRGIADCFLGSGLNSLNDCMFWSNQTMVTNNCRISAGKYSLINCDFAQTSFSAGQPNVNELSGVWSGNTILGSEIPYVTWNNQKTTLLNGLVAYAPSATIAGPISSASSITAGTTITATGSVQGGTVTSTGAASVGTNLTVGNNATISGNVANRGLNMAPLWNAVSSGTPTKPVIMFGFNNSAAAGTVSFGRTMANVGTVVILQPTDVVDTSNVHTPLVTGVTTTGFSFSKDIISTTGKSTENYGMYWIAIGEEA